MDDDMTFLESCLYLAIAGTVLLLGVFYMGRVW
jgi:hypothetical protein